ncbi:hypothetical protein KCP77_00600 [Salmonella enterica subsp. enterica]|nr:hypothetical protein KCP77_00600 [Salmonella enterica subsp. enterica]
MGSRDGGTHPAAQRLFLAAGDDLSKPPATRFWPLQKQGCRARMIFGLQGGSNIMGRRCAINAKVSDEAMREAFSPPP